MSRWLILSLSTAAMFSACAVSPHSNDPGGGSDASTEIRRVDAEWARAIDDGDVERIVSYWSDDATVMPPGAPAVVGKDAIRRFVVDSLNTPGFKVTWTTDAVVVSKSGDMAYATGTNHVTISGEDGEELQIDGKTATVWRYVAGQGWKCTLDIWNDAPGADEDTTDSM
jgi:uncharacterized protein (TIGR02246 family)